MSRLTILIGGVIGIAAVFVLYIAWVAHEFVTAGRSGKAVGVGVFPFVATSPSFVIAGLIVFVLAFYAVAR